MLAGRIGSSTPAARCTSTSRALRRSSDTAVPNKLFVALADAELGREGRMTAALASMGPSRFAGECVPFGVDSLHGPRDRAA